jgi:mRNA interferase MazF
LVIRGAVYRIDLGDAKRGREQRGRRYGVVLSHTDWSMVTVVPTSTSAQPSRFRPEVEIAGTSTRLLVDQIRSLDIGYVHGEPVGFLGLTDLTELAATVIRYLALAEK